MKVDFCEYCNTPLPSDEKLVTVHRHREGKHFIFERAPAKVCPRCGERYFSALAMREMDRLMKKPSASMTLVPIPVIELNPV